MPFDIVNVQGTLSERLHWMCCWYTVRVTFGLSKVNFMVWDDKICTPQKLVPIWYTRNCLLNTIKSPQYVTVSPSIKSVDAASGHDNRLGRKFYCILILCNVLTITQININPITLVYWCCLPQLQIDDKFVTLLMCEFLYIQVISK